MSQLIFLDSVLKMPGMPLPVRSVFVPLEKAGVLISPGTKLQPSDYQKLPQVTDLIGSNLLHTAGIPKALQSFPKARVWLPEDHEQKLKTKISGSTLTKEAWPFQAELAMITIKGMPKVNEVVFVHKKTGSLIVTDLGFNLTKVSGLGPWIILNLFGSYKRFALSKFYLRNIVDRKAFQDSIYEMMQFDFDQIIVSHGENIYSGGKEIFKKALAERNF